MRRAGEVITTAQGLAVCRAPDEYYAGIGSTVVDDQLETVGRVVDVFGPVDRPYVAVSPDDDIHLPTLVGRPLYERDDA